jgi:hypothetical protein
MQTFLPYPNFTLSAQVLDYRRLGKQRVEVLQLLKGSWPNHPASKMWRGYQYQLAEYGKAICLEWIGRGYNDTCLEKIAVLQVDFVDTGLPPWFGDPEFHESHRSNLIRKNPSFYAPKFSNTREGLEYIWPITKPNASAVAVMI